MTLLGHSSLKAALVCDCDDPQARQEGLPRLVDEAESLDGNMPHFTRGSMYCRVWLCHPGRHGAARLLRSDSRHGTGQARENREEVRRNSLEFQRNSEDVSVVGLCLYHL